MQNLMSVLELDSLNPEPAEPGGCSYRATKGVRHGRRQTQLGTPRPRQDQYRRRYEVQYWSEKFGISVEELTAAVKEVGPTASDVQRELKTHSHNWASEKEPRGANNQT